MKRKIEYELNRVREITANHIPDKTDLRFDYDCMLYREGTIRDMLSVMETLDGSGKRILDLGCGFGPVAAVLSSFGYQVYGIDVQETAEYYNHFKLGADSFVNIWRDLELHYPGVCYQFYKPYALPFDTGFFDAVIYYAAIEHMPKGDAATSLNETHRVLNKNGTLFVFRCPNAISLCENLARLFGIPGHETLYKESELKRLIQENGFNLSNFRKTDLFPAFFPIPIQRFLDMNGFWLSPLQDVLQHIGFEKWAHHFSVVAGKK